MTNSIVAIIALTNAVIASIPSHPSVDDEIDAKRKIIREMIREHATHRYVINVVNAVTREYREYRIHHMNEPKKEYERSLK